MSSPFFLLLSAAVHLLGLRSTGSRFLGLFGRDGFLISAGHELSQVLGVNQIAGADVFDTDFQGRIMIICQSRGLRLVMLVDDLIRAVDQCIGMPALGLYIDKAKLLERANPA